MRFDQEHKMAVAIGLCESIIVEIRRRGPESMYPEEWDDLCRSLQPIEDRVYRCGEYDQSKNKEARQ